MRHFMTKHGLLSAYFTNFRHNTDFLKGRQRYNRKGIPQADSAMKFRKFQQSIEIAFSSGSASLRRELSRLLFLQSQKSLPRRRLLKEPIPLTGPQFHFR